MDVLARHVAEQLTQKDSCTVFRHDITRAWPALADAIEKRHAEIHAFAKARGWIATITEPGMVVTFRKSGP
jgi:hypothetical protein